MSRCAARRGAPDVALPRARWGAVWGFGDTVFATARYGARWRRRARLSRPS
jgi:hypothetical protein